MKWVDRVHDRYHANRRVGILAGHLAALLPEGASVLDVGCGDGLLAQSILRLREDLRVSGVEVMVRPGSAIEVRAFDGTSLPFEDGAFDVTLASDVLHHAEAPGRLLAEMARVAADCVALKDHNRDGWLAGPTLRLMDWVGNVRHGVALPYNYWTRAQWREAFERLDLVEDGYRERLGIYPGPASWIFDRRLHFVTRLFHRGRVRRSADPAGEQAAQ